jgi:hypothetical protein
LKRKGGLDYDLDYTHYTLQHPDIEQQSHQPLAALSRTTIQDHAAKRL